MLRAQRRRLDPAILNLPVEKMREGYYSDVYFKRAREILEKDGYHPAKVEIDTLDTISLGLVLVRLAKGARITIEFVRVNNEVSLLKQMAVTAVVRVLLLKDMRIDMQMDFSAYKKFQAESRILSTGEVK